MFMRIIGSCSTCGHVYLHRHIHSFTHCIISLAKSEWACCENSNGVVHCKFVVVNSNIVGEGNEKGMGEKTERKRGEGEREGDVVSGGGGEGEKGWENWRTIDLSNYLSIAN